jgi:hypothetical protein
MNVFLFADYLALAMTSIICFRHGNIAKPQNIGQAFGIMDGGYAVCQSFELLVNSVVKVLIALIVFGYFCLLEREDFGVLEIIYGCVRECL